jgi:hypothetical protein
MLHRLCGPPSIPLSFKLAFVLPRWDTYHFRLATQYCYQTASIHRLRRGLPGYLILFATHAFVHQRQSFVSNLPSQLVFHVISKHFTATLHILVTSQKFKPNSINGNFLVKPKTFTADLLSRLRTL